MSTVPTLTVVSTVSSYCIPCSDTNYYGEWRVTWYSPQTGPRLSPFKKWLNYKSNIRERFLWSNAHHLLRRNFIFMYFCWKCVFVLYHSRSLCAHRAYHGLKVSTFIEWTLFRYVHNYLRPPPPPQKYPVRVCVRTRCFKHGSRFVVCCRPDCWEKARRTWLYLATIHPYALHAEWPLSQRQQHVCLFSSHSDPPPPFSGFDPLGWRLAGDNFGVSYIELKISFLSLFEVIESSTFAYIKTGPPSIPRICNFYTVIYILPLLIWILKIEPSL